MDKRKMHLLEISTIEQLKKIKPIWNEMLADSSLNTVFLTYEWILAWLENFGAKEHVRILTVYEDDQIMSAAPLMIKKARYRNVPVKVFQFIENNETGRSNIIIRNKVDKKAIIDILMNNIFFCSKDKWDLIHLRNIPSDSSVIKYIRNFLENNQIKFEIKTRLCAPFIVIDKPWDDFIKNRSHFNKKIRNASNKIRKLGELSLLNIKKFDDFLEIIPMIESISSTSWLRKRGIDIFGEEKRKNFFIDLSRIASEKGWLSVWLLKLDEEPIAYEYHLNYNNKIYALRASFKSNYEKVSPGFVLESLIIRTYFHEFDGLPIIYDLCGGMNFYKTRWTQKFQEHIDIVIYRSGLFGASLYYLESLLIDWGKKKLRLDNYRKSNNPFFSKALYESSHSTEGRTSIKEKIVEGDKKEVNNDSKLRLISQYSMSKEEADVLTSSEFLMEYFEACCRFVSRPKKAANWIVNELLGEIKKQSKDVDNIPISPENFGFLISMIEEENISRKMAKKVLKEMILTGEHPTRIIRDRGLGQIKSEEVIKSVVTEVVAEHPNVVIKYKEGNKKVINYLVGETMKRTKGKANPEIVRKVLIGITGR